jgi:hypothetical protein
MKGLTREQTKGTLTFHLPLQRGPETPPEMTLMVRRVAADQWHAGVAVCSAGDMFEKRIGRKLAFHRLTGNPVKANTPDTLVDVLWERLECLSQNRPYTLSVITVQEVEDLLPRISEMRIE